MNLAIDRAGQDQGLAEIMPFAGGGRFALADELDRFTADRDETLFDHIGRPNNAACQNQIKINHAEASFLRRLHSAPSLPGAIIEMHELRDSLARNQLPPSSRPVEETLLERGIIVSYETIR